MFNLKVKVTVVLKEGILDPQGKAVLHAINDLKFDGVRDVRIGKYIELTFKEQDKTLVEREAKDICQKILSNPVMEKFEYQIEEKP